MSVMKVLKGIAIVAIAIIACFIVLIILMKVLFIDVNEKEQKNCETVQGDGAQKALILYQESRGNFVVNTLHVVANRLQKNGYQVIMNHPREDSAYTVSDYDLVVLLTPVYGGMVAKPLCQYVDKQDFTGVKVVNIITGLNEGKDETVDLESHIKNPKEMNSIKISKLDEQTIKIVQNMLECDDAMTGQVYQPFQMKISPIEKLMLYNFEKNPDEIYKGLELQYWVVNETEKGYVIIAYRNDEYVDVYAEESLKDTEFGDFEVCGKGLKNMIIESLGNPVFELSDFGITSSFQFEDVTGRLVSVSVKENSQKKSKTMDLIAPVGLSSENPVVFPAFAMYDFDFVRKNNSEVEIEIDGKKMIPDPFPVPIPKDGQTRYFMRYGYDCELVEFAPSEEKTLELYDYEKSLVCKDGLVAKYKTKDNEIKLESLSFEKSRHTFVLQFLDLFPDIIRMGDGIVDGEFRIQMDSTMGNISGKYSVQKNQEMVTIILEPSGGWNSKNKTIISKMMLQKKSFFREWPKSYRYTQTININTGKSQSKWERIEE